MILPFGKEDEHLQGKEIKLPIAPLFLDNARMEKFGQEKFIQLNLTSAEKKSGEDNNITFSFDSVVDTDLEKK